MLNAPKRICFRAVPLLAIWIGDGDYSSYVRRPFILVFLSWLRDVKIYKILH